MSLVMLVIHILNKKPMQFIDRYTVQNFEDFCLKISWVYNSV